MEFQITGHNIEVTPALRETVEKKLKKLEQLFDRINSIQVVLKVEKVQQIAEATLQLNGAEIHASAEDDDMYAALDLLLDKLSRQLTKHKEKLRQH
ncbi:ribosome hibernation promoting factor [Providencia sp. PROV188]|jgi:putative sigma-54 modulation protein|uniref:Ribosome hibernation promoting factor n=1 Tax=Providencia alcalifaciens TaxID=126385 RepID=A0A4R3NGP7_9GAMM|nr:MULTISPECIES: ribosome hibernation promoting factor [Providencia]ETS98323.1 ribosomal subunit interface protein [Providencia alcalifaciens PAL-3]EUC98046.1 ribosomal subunit interface protein [Providencia alcalifaciens PAL-1]MBC5791785.1 ribosome hibernation promoting factor [Providencia sp. JUb39]MBG5883247.1 ribosome hibernation promoting factor [Providencia alcalifaciens]MBS0923084.1 ribosome hibernation promoting factor [Providencia sp. JGM181]